MSPGARSMAIAPHRTEGAVDADLREQVAWSCRILAMGGHGDYTLGHVSARAGRWRAHPDEAERSGTGRGGAR